MSEDRVQRRLAAIICADVVGYSAMMGRDEAGTLGRLKTLRTEFLHPKIDEYGGRVVKTTGDGTLIEFPSAIDALQHAIEVQRGLAERNADLPDDQKIRLRLGINVGDIIVDGDDIFGDGVNVAARLETIAEPGGICISSRVHEYVAGRLDVSYDDLGPQLLKNIVEPIRAFRVRADGKPTYTPHATTSNDQPLAIPSKPSVAVLPFENMSGDPEQEHFSDGISEDIITALSQIQEFFVIARNTTFTYKGKSVDVSDLAKELGVRYVLEGSVRRAGNRVRITAQLIDGQTGNHIWADRYDRELQDIFAVQDEITRTVVGTLGPELSRSEQRRALIKPPENLDAWELFHRGMYHLYRRTHEDNLQARIFFERAIKRDPNFAGPYGGMSRTYSTDWLFAETQLDKGLALNLARKAVSLDDRASLSHVALGLAHLLVHHDAGAALVAFGDGIRVNPNDAQGYNGRAMSLMALGRADEAITDLEQAIRLSPSDANIGIFFGRLALAHLLLKHFDTAIEFGLQAAEKTNVWIERLALPAALGHLGRLDEAGSALEEIRSKMPALSLKLVRDREPSSGSSYFEVLLDRLRAAGLPETP
ncbi:MAG: adenylate/guanylate cyclase domain-containing protein [Salaquimonas sp.]|nr:adenylate/guanylate cyclase domain-containing protein [Salaquimonas sp.]